MEIKSLKPSKQSDYPAVKVGATVYMRRNRKNFHFKIVNTEKVNPAKGTISDRSPLGKALIGSHIGQTVKVILPADTYSYKVLGIT